MQLYRLTRSANAASAFDGRRAAECPGRWNVAGKPAVYTAASLALALVELVSQGAPLWQPLFVYPLELDDAPLEHLQLEALPANWPSLAGRDRCRELAEAWRTRGSSVGIVVPSAVVPDAYARGEVDVVLNPRHPAFGGVRIGEPSRLRLGTQKGAL